MSMPRWLNLAALALLLTLTLVNQPQGESFGRGMNVALGFLASTGVCLLLAAAWLGIFLWRWGCGGWNAAACRTALPALLWSVGNAAFVGVLFATVRLCCAG